MHSLALNDNVKQQHRFIAQLNAFHALDIFAHTFSGRDMYSIPPLNGELPITFEYVREVCVCVYRVMC